MCSGRVSNNRYAWCVYVADIMLAYVNSNTCAQDKEKRVLLDVSA